jgi:FkbM family methyltransferase
MTTATLVRVCDHTLYLDGRAMKIVVDLGMNKGEFSNWVVNNTDARCVGVEPVPSLYRTLPRGDRIEAVQAAVGATPGKQSLCMPRGTCASLASAGLTRDGDRVEVEVITLDALMRARRLEWIDLLKIDIEGAEVELLEGLDKQTFARIGQMTVEFHDFVRPSDQPRVAKVVARIRDNGFYVVNFGRRHFTDVMCLNRAAFDVDLKLRARLIAAKYARGAKRVITRLPSAAARAALGIKAAVSN